MDGGLVIVVTIFATLFFARPDLFDVTPKQLAHDVSTWLKQAWNEAKEVIK